MASQTFMMRAGQQPALAVILGIAGVIGFGIGTWLGNVTRPTGVAAVQPSASVVVVTPSPLTTPSPTVSASATPTQAPSPTQRPPAPQQVILSLDGDSHEVSESFEVKPGWQIQWQIEGSSIAIAVTGEETLGVIIEQEGPASGVRGIPEGGVFRLEIAANGPWTITVVDGEDPLPTAS